MIFSLLILAVIGTAELDFVDALEVHVQPERRLDLSGVLVLSPKLKKDFQLESFDLLLVNDRDSWIYRARIAGDRVRAEPWLQVKMDWGVRHDFEDIETDSKNILLLNEGDGSLIEVSRALKLRLIQWQLPKGAPPFTDWFGAEALAWKPPSFWVFREMPPLLAFQVGSGLKVRQVGREGKGSQTAARYRDGFWYVLDRENRCVWISKDLRKNEVCHSFGKWVDEEQFYRFQVRDSKNVLRPEWSTAEALDLDDKHLWIGLDNNAEGLYRDLSMTNPVLLRFKRP